MNSSCPTQYPILIENKMECVEFFNFEVIKDILNIRGNETKKSKEEEIK